MEYRVKCKAVISFERTVCVFQLPGSMTFAADGIWKDRWLGAILQCHLSLLDVEREQ